MEQTPTQTDLTKETEVPAPENPDIIPEARRAYSRSILNLFIYWVIGIVLVLSISTLLKNQIENNKAVLYLANFLPMYLISFPTYLFLSKKVPASPPQQGLKMKPHHFILAFFCAEALGIAGNLIGIVINLILTLISGVETSSTFLQDGILGDHPALLIFFAIFCAPIVEEMLFRKILIDRIRQYGTGTAVLVSGLLFGLFHGNFSQFFYAAMIGMFFAYIYLRTGKVIYTIILHMIVNTWGSLIPLLFLQNLDTAKILEAIQSSDLKVLTGMLHELTPFIGFSVFTYSIALTGLILLIVNKPKFSLPPAEKAVPKAKRFSVAFINVGAILFFCACVAEFLIQIFENL